MKEEEEEKVDDVEKGGYEEEAEMEEEGQRNIKKEQIPELLVFNTGICWTITAVDRLLCVRT